jgi:hypothetical protein
MHGQTNKSFIYNTIQENVFHEHESSEAWFTSCGFWAKKEIAHSVSFFPHVGTAGNGLLGPHSLAPNFTGSV